MITKSTNQLKIGDVFKHPYTQGDRDWREVIGFSNKGHVKAKMLAPFYSGMETTVQCRNGVRWIVLEESDPPINYG